MRRRRAALLAFGTVLATVTATGVAHAGPAPIAASVTPTVTLLGQPSWVPTGGSAVLSIDVQPATDGLEIRYSVYEGLTSRTSFDETLTGSGLGTPSARNSVDYRSLPASAEGGRGLFLGLQTATGAQGGLPIDEPGVYPLEIDLVDASGAILDGFVTYLVVLEPATSAEPTVAEQLRVAWIWPLTAAPALRPDGSPEPAVVEELLPTGRIGRQLRALAAAARVDVTIAPSPETTDSWASLARQNPRLEAGLADLGTVARRNEVLTGPYVQLDYPAIIAGGLGERVAPELVAGAGALDRHLDVVLDPRTAIVRPASQTALEDLRGLGIDRVFLDARALAAETFDLTPARPFALQLDDPEIGATQITGAAGDPGFEAILADEETAPALRAQQLLAGMSLVALEQPTAVRGIALVNPDDWDPEPKFLSATLDGLADHPLLEPITAGEYFDLSLEPAADGAGILVRELAPAPPPADPPVGAEAYFNAFAEQDAFRAFLGADDPKLAPGDRALLVSLSAVYQSPFGRLQAAAELEVIPLTIDGELALIRVPEEGTVTLTAREGDVPVTFLNETGRDVRVRIELNSQQLQFPDGTVREVVLPPRSSTVRFAVEARSQGNYPLTLHVTTVDGGLPVESTRVHVRSTFVSGVGKFLTVGAAAFLAIWWGLDIRKRRRRARAATTA